MKKKCMAIILSAFLAVLPVCSAIAAEQAGSDESVPAEAFASVTVTAEGSCGDNASWILASDGTLTISGTGAMTEWSSAESVSWYEWADEIETVTVESGITTIGKYAFYSYDNLSSVILGDTLTEIETMAFDFCDALEQIELPDSLTTIGLFAFSYAGLTELVIPDSVTSIDNWAFSGCRSLTSVTLPSDQPDYGSYVFAFCTSLTVAEIPDGWTSIEESTFSGCTGLTAVIVPDTLTAVEESAFKNCSSLSDVYYAGTEEEWASISVSSSNTYFAGATVHYNGEDRDSIYADDTQSESTDDTQSESTDDTQSGSTDDTESGSTDDTVSGSTTADSDDDAADTDTSDADTSDTDTSDTDTSDTDTSDTDTSDTDTSDTDTSDTDTSDTDTSDTDTSDTDTSDTDISDTDTSGTDTSDTDTSDTSEETESTADTSTAGTTMDTAWDLSFGTTYSDSISSDNTEDYYRVTLASSGAVYVKGTAYVSALTFEIYDLDGTSIGSYSQSYDEHTGMFSFKVQAELTAGTYYFSIHRYYSEWGNGGYGDYSFQMSFVSAGESFAEEKGGSDNTLLTANTVSLNKTYKGQIALNDSQDFYKFTLGSSGEVTVSTNNNIESINYYLYDEDGNELDSVSFDYNADLGDYSLESFTCDLTAGTYYLMAGQDSSNCGNYSFTLTLDSAEESFAETSGGNNNSFAAADSISLNKTYKGQIAVNDTQDFYTFKLTSQQTININFIADFTYSTYALYDADGNEKWSSKVPSKDSKLGLVVVNEEITLSAGTYYLTVKYGRTGWAKEYSADDYGAYTFSVKTTSGTTTTGTSSSSGKLKITVKAGKKKIKVSWKKQTGAVKYQVSYRKKGSKKWKTKTVKKTKATLKKLKSGKKYQVRVRAVKKVNGKKKYGSWSKTRTVKVK